MGAVAKQIDIADQQWFTSAEACAYMRMSRSDMQAHISRGTLRPDSRSRPGFKLHRFRRATLDAFLTGENDNG